MAGVLHSKHRRGCDCLNQTGDINDAVQGGRCEHCADPYREALCAYIAHFGCDYWTGVGTTREKFTEPCLVLRADCIYGCTYSSRWYCPDSDPKQDRPKLRWEGCDLLTRSGFRCEQCESVKCIGGTITRLTKPDAIAIEDWCFDSINGDVDLQFLLSYVGEVVTERDVEVYPGSCMWSGIAIDQATGNELYEIPIFVDLVDGNWRIRIYFPDVAPLSDCLPPSAIADLLGFYRIDIYPDDFTCGTFSNVTYDGDAPDPAPPYVWLYESPAAPGVEINIIDWDLQTICRPPAQLTMGACTWAQEPCSGPDGCDQSQEVDPAYDEFGDTIDTCFTKWRMTITSPTTATLDLVTREGFTAQYLCNDFHCYEPSNFHLQPGYSSAVIGLLPCLCVSPASYAPEGCANSGLEACCDSGGPTLPVRLTVSDCDSEVVFDGYWPFTRGGPLPCGVGNPFPYDDCLYFKAIIPVDEGCAEWGGDIFVLMYCSEVGDPAVTPPCDEFTTGPGNEKYNFVWYCYDPVTECWEEQGSTCAAYTCTCLGPEPAALAITKECCCPECIECGPCEDLPATVNYDVTTELGGTCSGTIAKDCDGLVYEQSGCTIGGHSIGFTFNPTDCTFTVDCNADTGQNETIDTASCDPLDVTIEFDATNTDCLEDLGRITIRIYE